MVLRDSLIEYLTELLDPQTIADYVPNGLQVEGKTEIHKLITGVTANQALIDAAIKKHADAILVHHGFFWKNENPCILNYKQKRLRGLLNNEINLFAYHLPLDVHSVFGNNVQLGNILDIEVQGTFDTKTPTPLGLWGKFEKPISANHFAKLLEERLQHPPLHIHAQKSSIETIAWCTGAGYDFIEQAKSQGVDAYLTGEIAERTVHLARELDIHFFAAGHHATERFGVQALGEHLAQQFQIEHVFIDIDCPV